MKMWTGKDVSVPYANFDKQRNAISEAPGVNQLGRIGTTPGLVYEQASVAPNSETPHREIGYDYLVTFDIDGANEAKVRNCSVLRMPYFIFPIRSVACWVLPVTVI